MSTVTWQIDPAHSQINFRVRHLMVSNVTGRFQNFQSSIETEGEDLTSAKISFTAETASVFTGVADRDAHLRSDDFFNAEAFPEIRFESTSVRKTGEDTYEIDGNLTIRDITQPVTLQVEQGGKATDPWGNEKMGFEATTSVSRKSYGLKWNALTEAGGAVASDEVKITLDVQYVKQA